MSDEHENQFGRYMPSNADEGASKSPRTVMVGKEVERYRTAAQLSQRRLADLAKVSNATLSRLEAGLQMPRTATLAAILGALSVPGYRRDELIDMAEHVGEPQWAAVGELERQRQSEVLRTYEDTAYRIVSISPLLVCGPAQTEAYTWALMEQGGIPADDIPERVAFRAKRAALLTKRNPAYFVMVIGEAAMRQRIGTPATMLEQLRHLLSVAALPNVDLRLMPIRCQWNPALEGPFVLLDTNAESAVHIEGRIAGVFLHQPPEIAAYRDSVTMVLDAAMSAAESVDAIAAVIAEIEETETSG